ncbi:MAG TPA: hypothetical protein VGJ13_18720 [Pseudonocardiaceae bacterium]|jgi:hypothetical protein
MLPPDLVHRAAFAGHNVAALLMNLVVNGTLFVTTLYLQGVQHRSPLAAGLALLPLFVPLAALAPLARAGSPAGSGPVSRSSPVPLSRPVAWPRYGCPSSPAPTRPCCPPCSGWASGLPCSPRPS